MKEMCILNNAMLENRGNALLFVNYEKNAKCKEKGKICKICKTTTRYPFNVYRIVTHIYSAYFAYGYTPYFADAGPAAGLRRPPVRSTTSHRLGVVRARRPAAIFNRP